MSGTIPGGAFDNDDFSDSDRGLIDSILETLGVTEGQLVIGGEVADEGSNVVVVGGTVVVVPDTESSERIVISNNDPDNTAVIISGGAENNLEIQGLVQAFGGSGNDTISFLFGNGDSPASPSSNEAVARQVDGEANLANLYGNFDDDEVTGGVGVDAVYGGQGNDTVIDNGSNFTFGNKGDDLVLGSGGDDVLYGNIGIDVLNGGDGDDALYGGKGADALTGSGGDDLLIGGKGEDTYVYLGGGEGDDVVNGFVIGEDVIQVTSSVAGDTATLQASGITDTPDGALVSFADGTTVTLEGISAQDVLDNFDSVFNIV